MDPEIVESPIGTLTRQPDGNYKTASGTTVARSVALSYANSQPKEKPTTEKFPDGSLRQWNPATKGWDVIGVAASSAGKYNFTGLPDGYRKDAEGNVQVRDSSMASGWRDATEAEYAALNAPAPRAPAQAPVARFGFVTQGGRVFRTNDLAGTREDIGPSAGFEKLEIDRNGNLVGITGEGKVTTLSPGFDYAKVDPRETAAENRRQFDESQGGLDRRENQRETGLNSRNSQNEQGSYDRAVLNEGEANRRAALNSQTQGFTAVTNSVAPLGRLALDNAAFIRDTYSKPSDFASAARATRGLSSGPGRTQADSINQLSSSIGAYNTALQGFNTSPVAGFGTSTAPYVRAAAPAPIATTGPVARVLPPTTYVMDGPNAGALADTVTGRARANDNLRAAGAPSWLPGFADGTGMTREPMFKVGEEQDGSMNDTSEVIVNPENAPIGVISNEELTGNPADDMEAEEHQKKAKAIGKVMQFVDNPDVLHALVDEMDDHKKQAKPAKKMPGFNAGTGMGFAASSTVAGPYAGLQSTFDRGAQTGRPASDTIAPMAVNNTPQAGFSFPGIPQIPGVAGTTQAQIQADELANRPPAITSILNGQRPTPLNLGFSLPTPGLLASLTDREKEAFGTTLATQYNLAPSDVESAIRQRFAGSGARSARF